MSSKYIDPTKCRISEHFMLSDFMGCESVYRGVSSNRILKTDTTKIDEVKNLCEKILEPVIDITGSISIAYGHISDQLSRRIIKYQDPKKPSYHRWDLGAAADIIPHEWVEHTAPAIFAAHLDEAIDEYARMIVYSESPCICVATSLAEKNRRAFYENRFDGIGHKKPTFVRYSNKDATRSKQIADMRTLDYSRWKGEGYPTYHGGGKQQMHHIRISKYTVLSDYMYSRDLVHAGKPNLPTEHDARVRDNLVGAGAVYDLIVEKIGRCSIVRAYVHNDSSRNYRDRWVMDIVPPESIGVDPVARVLSNNRIKHSKADGRLIIWGNS